MKRKVIVAICATVATPFLCCGGFMFLLWDDITRLERTAKELVGEPEATVVEAFGKPYHMVDARTAARKSIDEPWKQRGYTPVPSRKVTNKVLMYDRMGRAVYIFIDKRGFVEAVETARVKNR